MPELSEPALLELRVPQVLREAVVDLAGQPCALLEGRGGELRVGEASHLDVRGAQLAKVVTPIDDDAGQQDGIEAEAQEVAGGREPGVRPGMHGRRAPG